MLPIDSWYAALAGGREHDRFRPRRPRRNIPLAGLRVRVGHSLIELGRAIAAEGRQRTPLPNGD